MVDTYADSPIHCESGPAVVMADGEEVYYCDGRRLTLDQYNERLKISPHYYHMSNGVTQRIWTDKLTNRVSRKDGPAIESTDGSYTAWMLNGQFHRVGAPAVFKNEKIKCEEEYYFYGKLHNPDGPAKINHVTNRSSYYLDGERYSKEKFMEKKRTHSKLKQAVKRQLCHGIYRQAYDMFKRSLAHTNKSTLSSEVHNLISFAKQLKSTEESRSAALAVYHALIGEHHPLTAQEFYDCYDSLDQEDSAFYVMDSGENTFYELYLATFVIQSLDPGAVFTAMSQDPEVMNVVSEAIDECDEHELPCNERDFSSNPNISMNSEVNDIEVTDVKPAESMSWTLPLLLAAGVSVVGKLYGKTKQKEQKKELKWASVKK